MKIATHGLASTTTGILMGDIGAVYQVVSYLIDRPAFTHELAHYQERAAAALRAVYPDLPEATRDNWKQALAETEAKYGAEIEMDAALKGVLADDKDPIQTLRDMGFKGAVLTVDPAR